MPAATGGTARSLAGPRRDSSRAPVKAKALYDYSGASAEEATFAEGDELLVVDQEDANWWRVDVGGAKILVAPATYLEAFWLVWSPPIFSFRSGLPLAFLSSPVAPSAGPRHRVPGSISIESRTVPHFASRLLPRMTTRPGGRGKGGPAVRVPCDPGRPGPPCLQPLASVEVGLSVLFRVRHERERLRRGSVLRRTSLSFLSALRASHAYRVDLRLAGKVRTHGKHHSMQADPRDTRRRTAIRARASWCARTRSSPEPTSTDSKSAWGGGGCRHQKPSARPSSMWTPISARQPAPVRPAAQATSAAVDEADEEAQLGCLRWQHRLPRTARQRSRACARIVRCKRAIEASKMEAVAYALGTIDAESSAATRSGVGMEGQASDSEDTDSTQDGPRVTTMTMKIKKIAVQP
ncbi:hypothetical protein L1887_47830 [Cichorium endivia]|nr:hypothetical protein L1887_47830 [Cichorium endivia]